MVCFDTKSSFYDIGNKLNNYKQGILSLVAILLSCLPLFASNYLYKDQVIHKIKFTKYVNQMGSELYNKTHIALRLVILKKLNVNQTILDYEENLIKKFNTPTVLLTFVAKNRKVDILARPKSLYKYFNKEQVLSPASSFFNSLFLAIIYSKNFSEFKATALNDGGTIIPLLAQKTKKFQNIDKYSAALFNGYADIASQIATAHGVKFKDEVGDSSRDTMDVIRIIFYTILLYGGYLYIKRRMKIREIKNENNR